jgi:hypothetical protein
MPPGGKKPGCFLGLAFEMIRDWAIIKEREGRR